MPRRTRRAVEPDEQDVPEAPFADREGPILVRGEGGSIWEQDLPLSEPLVDLYLAGRLTEVDRDTVEQVTDPDTKAARWLPVQPAEPKRRGRKPKAEPDADLVALQEAGLAGLTAEDIEALAEAQEAQLQELVDAGFEEGITAEDIEALNTGTGTSAGRGKAKS